jgi:hypothetical protein
MCSDLQWIEPLFSEPKHTVAPRPSSRAVHPRQDAIGLEDHALEFDLISRSP